MLSEESKKKLLCVADWLETKVPADQFDMGTWVDGNVELAEGDDIKVTNEYGTACGTTCCIAGWVCLAKGYRMDGAVLRGAARFQESMAPSLASRALGIDGSDAQKLFYPGMWPNETGDCYEKFPNTPKGAADRIRHFVETGE